MPYLALILIILCFLKTFYYGIYEINIENNKTGGIAICIFSILRLNFSNYYCNIKLYYIIFMLIHLF